MPANNWAYANGLGTGFNIERTASATPSFWASAIKSSTAQGCTHTRSFMPNTTVGPGGGASFGIPNWKAGAWVPTAADVDAYLDCGAAVLAAGQKWHFDCWDVFNDGDQSQWSTVEAIVTLCAQRFAARGFDKTRAMIGAVNEWAGTSAAMQAKIPGLRNQLSTLLQNILGTDQIIVENATNWGSIGDTTSSGFVLTSGIKTPFVQVHDYDNNDEAGWQNVEAELTAVEARLGCPAYLGEVGLNGQSGTFNLNIWTGSLGLIGSTIKHGKTVWAQTMGTDDRMNVSGSDGTLIGGIDWEAANNNSTQPKFTLTAAQAATTSTATTPTGGSGSTSGSSTGAPPVSTPPVSTPPATTAPVTTAPTSGELVINSANGTAGSSRYSFNMTKATGGAATVKFNLITGGKTTYQGTLVDNMPDGTSTYNVVATIGALTAGTVYDLQLYIEQTPPAANITSASVPIAIAAAASSAPPATTAPVSTPTITALLAEIKASPAALTQLQNALGVA